MGDSEKWPDFSRKPNGRVDWAELLKAMVVVGGILGTAVFAGDTRISMAERVTKAETRIDLNKETVEKAIRDASTDREQIKREVRETREGVQQILRRMDAREAVERDRERRRRDDESRLR